MLGYGINSLGYSTYANDPMFWNAYNSYNLNFRGTQQAAQQSPQTQTTAESTLPKADYGTKKSGTGSGLLIGGALATAVTAGACLIKGKGHPVKGAREFINAIKGVTGNIVKSTKSMKEFSFMAKDGSKVFVKDGKVTKIIEKGADKTVTEAKEINKLLRDKGINSADILDFTKAKNVKLTEYSFDIKYAGKNIKVENGKITKIGNTTVNDTAIIEKELGGKTNYDNFMKNIVEKVEKQEALAKGRKADNLKVKSYEWSQDGITGTAVLSKSKKGYHTTQLVENGVRKELSEVERSAFLERNSGLNNTINKLIAEGRADGVNVARSVIIDAKGNKLIRNSKGEIICVDLRDAIDIGNKKVKLLRGGSDRTNLDAWLHNNPEAKELAKKEFESGLASDGATFVAA